MTFDHELVLISTTHGENAIGDPVIIRTEKAVLCDVMSVTRAEYYQAAAHGLKPAIVFVINRWDYGSEKEVEFEGKRYTVQRTYLPKQSKGIHDFETLELVCAGVVSRGSA